MKNKCLKRARISEEKFREVLKYLSVDLPALTTARLSGWNYRTVHRLYELLRGQVVELALAEGREFAGEVEIDESYFGSRRVRGKRGRGAAGKTPVIGLHKRGHNVYVSVAKNCSARELWPIIAGRVLEGSEVYTDGWKAYDGLVLGGYQHHRIHHHQNGFTRGKNHVSGIESFWSFAKIPLPQTPRRPQRSLPLPPQRMRMALQSPPLTNLLLSPQNSPPFSPLSYIRSFVNLLYNGGSNVSRSVAYNSYHNRAAKWI